MARYTTNERGALVEAGIVSFAPMGVTFAGWGPVVGGSLVAADKAYFFDDDNQQVVIWDPTRMELTGGVIDLSAWLNEPVADQPELVPSANGDGDSAQRVGDLLFVPVRWRNRNAVFPQPYVFPSAGLLIIDTQRDEVVDLLLDERLVDTVYSIASEAGDVYLFSGAYGVSFNHVLGSGRPGGALRVLSGEARFDPDFYLDIDAVVDGRPTTQPVYAGGSTVFVRAYHEDIAPITEEIRAAPTGLINVEAWRYWKIDLTGNEAPLEVTEIPFSAVAGGVAYELDGRTFLGQAGADFASTQLYEVTEAGLVRSVSVTGLLQTLTPLDRTF